MHGIRGKGDLVDFYGFRFFGQVLRPHVVAVAFMTDLQKTEPIIYGEELFIFRFQAESRQ